MKKKVIKIDVVEYTAERGSRKGEKGEYIQLTLQNRGSNWIASVNQNEEHLFITRPQTVVDIWKDFAAQIKDGKKTVEEVVPDEYRLLENVFKVAVPLGEKMVRLYRKDEVDKSTGKVLHRKGDIVTLEDGKTPAIYDQLTVLAIKYEDDDTGEMQWLQTPESIVRSMVNRGYYKPLVANTASVEVANDEPDVNEAGAAEKPGEDAGEEPTLEELQAQLAALKAKGASA